MEDRSPRFATTRWSLVLATGGPASDDSRTALSSLCRTYWYPLYAYARRRGRDPEEAEDSVQGFLTHVIEKEGWAAADPDRGRFRTFLLVSFRHFLSNEVRAATAAKRGAGKRPLSLDREDPETRYNIEPAHMATPEKQFERDFALALLDRVLLKLRADYDKKGKAAQFDVLKDVLLGGTPTGTYAGKAEALSMSVGAVKVAAHRLRGRYRDALLDEITDTIDATEDPQNEIGKLISALAL